MAKKSKSTDTGKTSSNFSQGSKKRDTPSNVDNAKRGETTGWGGSGSDDTSNVTKTDKKSGG